MTPQRGISDATSQAVRAENLVIRELAASEVALFAAAAFWREAFLAALTVAHQARHEERWAARLLRETREELQRYTASQIGRDA